MLKSLTTLALVGAAITLVTSPALALNKWQRHHPARTEINARIANQNRRITQERREGDITGAQAHALRADDRSIRAQERADARANGNHGHLNGAQVKSLNQELNANSGAIGK